MSSINFLHKDEQENKKAQKIRSVVMPITTAIIVVYFVLLSGLLGWWWWWSNKQQQVSAEYASLKTQIDAKLQTEILARRMTDRVEVINSYLNSRNDIFLETDILVDKPFIVIRFGVAKEGYYFVDVQATESAVVSTLEDELRIKYKDVMLKSMIWEEDNANWVATYWYKTNKI